MLTWSVYHTNIDTHTQSDTQPSTCDDVYRVVYMSEQFFFIRGRPLKSQHYYNTSNNKKT